MSHIAALDNQSGFYFEKALTNKDIFGANTGCFFGFRNFLYENKIKIQNNT